MAESNVHIYDDTVLGNEELLNKYPDPKSIIKHALLCASLFYKSPDIKVSCTSFPQRTSEDKPKIMYHSRLCIPWPEKFKIESRANNIGEAETIVYLQACKKFKELGLLDNVNDLIIPQKYNSEELADAKDILNSIFSTLQEKFPNEDISVRFRRREEEGLFVNDLICRTRLIVSYPEENEFAGTALEPLAADGLASVEALRWLQERGIIDESLELIDAAHPEQEVSYHLELSTDLKLSMENVLKKFHDFKIENKCIFEDKTLAVEDGFDIILDVITGEPYAELDEALMRLPDESFFNWRFMQKLSICDLVTNARLSLPIAEQKKEVLDFIQANRVVVLSGGIGCGKSTQVPQYIFDFFIEKMQASKCSIVVAEPHDILASSIAQRVVFERNEDVGQTIGYDTQFDKTFPKTSCGAILFCTTEILLKKLHFNPDLIGISHVIIDEIQERTIHIDFLLASLKQVLQKNEDIKVILMTAFYNAPFISEYFSCTVMNFTKELYPVREYFLENYADSINHDGEMSLQPKFDIDLVIKVIQYVDSKEPLGSILCFLPDCHEIMRVKMYLNEEFGDSHHSIFAMHSTASVTEMEQIFPPPEDNFRKIVLATDIAEYSLTIDHVTHVIDCGLRMEASLGRSTGTSTLGLEWISQTNVNERKTRAGGMTSGSFYCVYTEEIFEKMNEFPTPEIRKVSVENLVLDCKFYCPRLETEHLLSQVPDPPDVSDVKRSIKILSIMGITDQDENLTILGDRVANISTPVCGIPIHPCLSKALAMALILRCVEPVLTIAALSTCRKDIFTEATDKNEQIRELKRGYDKSRFSDHLALYDLFIDWHCLGPDIPEAEKAEFLQTTLLNENALIQVKQLRNLFARKLFEVGLTEEADNCVDFLHNMNQNFQNMDFVLAALTYGFYPNIVKIKENPRTSTIKDATKYVTMDNGPASIHTMSVAFRKADLPNPYLLNFPAFKTYPNRALLYLTSNVSEANLLIFSGNELLIKTIPNVDEVQIIIDDYDNLSWICTKDTAQLLSQWRKCVFNLFEGYLRLSYHDHLLSLIADFHNSELFPVLKYFKKNNSFFQFNNETASFRTLFWKSA